MRFLPIGPTCLLVELDDLDQTLALFDALLADPVPGIAEIIPAARTLMIRTALGVRADDALAGQVLARQPTPGTTPGTPPPTRIGETVELPVSYTGADLAEVAALTGLGVAELVAAHQAALWQVAFCGFAPGFAYMTCDDPRFDVPRRPTPRTQIPAGAVALAGRFCGVYPHPTPGGWQLLGGTDLPMWDLSRDPPALLRPGLHCRFVARTGAIHPSAAMPASAAPPPDRREARGLRVISTRFPLLFQDEGRPGQGGQGISASGALDLGALRRANRAVGNPSDSPAPEITFGPVRLRAELPMVLALAGAGQAVVAGQPIPIGHAFTLDPGDEVVIGPPAAGMRSYLALRGGYDVAPVLGSASTDTLAFVGPPPVIAGAALVPAGRPAMAVSAPGDPPDLPRAGDLVELPVTLGPRTDWFAPEQLRHFLAQDWLVTTQSSRVGIRLEGSPVLRDAAELPSEGTETGAIQIPHSGQPVLFLADHPLTGGYPVIATLHPRALDLAGQIPPGARIRFVADGDFAPITPARPR